MANLIAYHGDPEIKQKYVARVCAHCLADEIVKGQYWEGGKGCAVGCTLHGDRHADYETELGVPRAMARLEDAIFENLPNGEAKEFPEAFLAAIPVGADLSRVSAQFTHWLMVDAEHGVLRFAKTDATKSAIKTVANLYSRRLNGDEPPTSGWKSARGAAYAAAHAADAAAAYAAAHAAHAADVAAYAHADAAAAYAAAHAADVAAAHAAYAHADAAARQKARTSHYLIMRDKLLSLLAEAPIPAQVEAP